MLFRDDLKSLAEKVRAKVFAACGDDADAIVSTDPTHVGYLSGYHTVQLDVDRNFRCAVVMTRDRTILVTAAADAAPALEVLRDPTSIYRYGMFYFFDSPGAAVDYAALPTPKATFVEALQSAIAAIVKARHTVGLDCANEAELAQFKEMVGAHSFDARPRIMKARSTKLPEEIERIRRAAHLTESGMEKALGQARAGTTELDMSAIIAAEMRAGGAVPRFILVTAGKRSALADAYSTTAVLAAGDLVRLDIGCSVDGYWADTARTAVVGEPSREQQQRYDALLSGESAQLAVARAGITAGDLFDVAVKRVREGALPNYKRHHCGHGIGLAAHEFPGLAPANQNAEIQDGMVLCVETPYYEIGWGGMMVEDMIVIRDGGHERLTHMSRELRRL